MSLQVIGAGLPRTGTTSLKTALEQLGFGPCNHMTQVMSQPDRWRPGVTPPTIGPPIGNISSPVILQRRFARLPVLPGATQAISAGQVHIDRARSRPLVHVN